MITYLGNVHNVQINFLSVKNYLNWIFFKTSIFRSTEHIKYNYFLAARFK